MNSILKFFIDRSFVVNLISGAIILMGFICFFSMKRDLIPAMQFKVITIQATLPGASAVEMEKFITFPIEENIKGIAGIAELNSTTQNNHTQITLKFQAAYENIEETVEIIKARIEDIKKYLPSDMEPIEVQRIKVDSVDFMGLYMSGVDQLNNSDRDWVNSFKEEILKIPGMVSISSSLQNRKIFIEIDKQKLLRYGISVTLVRQKILEAFSYKPVGTLEKDEATISIELRKMINSLADVKKIPISGNLSGKYIFLEDVAEVNYRFAQDKKLHFVDGESAIFLSLSKDLVSDSIDLRNQIRQVITQYNKKFPSHIKADIFADGTVFIEKQLDVLSSNGLIGILLVCIALFLLLGGRVSLMTALGLPLSYLGTFIILSFLGISIDLISVVGMILVIGLLVDDAIIVSEKYVENLSLGQVPATAALNAAKDTMLPVSATVITTMAAFLPLMLVPGEMSEIIFAIPCVIISALTLSWFESFFILPNHLRHFVKTPSKKSASKTFKKVTELYQRGLQFILKWRYLVLVGFLAFFIFSLIWAFNFIPKNFSISIGSIFYNITAVLKESPSLEHTKKTLRPLEDYFLSLKPQIDHLHTKVGTVTINKLDKTGNRFATIKIYLPNDGTEQKELKQRLRTLIEKGLNEYKTEQFEELYLDEQMQGAEEQENTIVPIFVSGGDKLSFEELQEEIENIIAKVSGVESIFIDKERLQSSWIFNAEKDRLIRHQVSSFGLSDQLREYFSPIKVQELRFNGEQTQVYTQYKDIESIEYQHLNAIKIINSLNIPIPITMLGQWEKQRILKKINHDFLLRKFEIDVRYDKAKITREKIATQIDQELAPLKEKYPAYNFSVEKESKTEKRTKSWLIQISIVVVILIFLILSLCLNSVVKSFLVVLAIPFGIIGIVWALQLHSHPLSFMALIGLIGMAGVVVNDSLIMVYEINNLQGVSYQEAILAGAGKRLRAILLTTITTLGGVFPMAYGLGGESGFTQPIAFSLGWGIGFATFLTLFLLPALLAIFEDTKKLAKKLMERGKQLI